jgi:hypothetical protein
MFHQSGDFNGEHKVKQAASGESRDFPRVDISGGGAFAAYAGKTKGRLKKAGLRRIAVRQRIPPFQLDPASLDERPFRVENGEVKYVRAPR